MIMKNWRIVVSFEIIKLYLDMYKKFFFFCVKKEEEYV